MSRSSRRFSINDVVLPPNLVKGLSLEMLRELSKQDDATFYQFFEGLDLSDIKSARGKTQSLRESNQQLAAKNVELEPKFKEVKAELMQKVIELNSLKEEYDKRYMELKVIQSKQNHQAVEKELREAAKKVERDSEDLASDFVGGKSSLSLEQFQDEYLKQRTLYWLRKVKVEKMKELLQNYRPTAAPRTVHSTTASTSQPPAPQGASNFTSPLHSLPAQQQHPPPQGSSPGYPPNPSSSLPPYPQHSHMPNPNPFPAAAYTPYPRPTITKPPPYVGSAANRFNQHRY